MTDFRQRKAIERLEQAERALARGSLTEAASAFEHGLRLDPRAPGARGGWERWAETLEAQGERVEAARVWAEALAHHPGDPSLELSLAAAQLETGQFEAATTGLLGLVERWPGERTPLAFLARALRDTRRFGELRERLEAALAGPFAGDAELAGLLDSCRGWQGERDEPAPPPPTMRELLLSRYGVILLGTGHDDGFAIPWYATYLCSSYDVAATCARLLAFAGQFGWRWARVAAIDEPGKVLAALMGGALGIDVVDVVEVVDVVDELDPATTLGVATFLGPGWEQSLGEAGAWGLRCAEAGNLFAFGALDYTRHSAPLPPLLGMAAGDRVCLPWWRLGEARIGFSRAGLIDDLPPEVDPRPAEHIAGEYRRALADFELGPGAVTALRHVHAHRAELQGGLRRRSDFARIPPRAPSHRGPQLELEEALRRGGTAEFFRALGVLEGDHSRVGERELELLEARFAASPGVRSRLSDLLYAVAPARFAATLERLIARPEQEVRVDERDGLLHLYGCSPWGTRATEELRRWLTLGCMSNRSEIVQSKYGLHWLCERDPGEVLAQLFDDEPPVVIGGLRWLHDNPRFHGHAGQTLGLLDHDHADVVFEAFQCARVAGLSLSSDRLEPFLSHSHPRLRSAAVEHLELPHPDRTQAEVHGALSALVEASLAEGRSELDAEVCWAATRSLTRGGVDLEARRRGAQLAAGSFVSRAPEIVGGGALGALGRQMIRAVASSEDFEVFEAWLTATDSPSLLKVFAAAFTPALVGLDDPRFLAILRRHGEVFTLDPPRGFASFVGRHGSGQDPRDRAVVVGARGARDLRAGYEAAAVLARWGDGEAQRELDRAVGYASPYAEAAFEARWAVLEAQREAPDCAALDGVLDQPSRVPALWRVLTATLSERPASAPWLGALGAFVRGNWRRQERWSAFIEAQLRAQIPSKFVVGAASADFGVLEQLLPGPFDELVARTFGGTPDRFAVDLLEWLGHHHPARARRWLSATLASPHWGLRQVARRLSSAVR